MSARFREVTNNAYDYRHLVHANQAYSQSELLLENVNVCSVKLVANINNGYEHNSIYTDTGAYSSNRQTNDGVYDDLRENSHFQAAKYTNE